MRPATVIVGRSITGADDIEIAVREFKHALACVANGGEQ